MGRIVVTEFISVDGVIEDPGGSEDFKYGGWSFEFSRGEEGDSSSSTRRATRARCCSAARRMRASPTRGLSARASSPTSSTTCLSTSCRRP